MSNTAFRPALIALLWLAPVVALAADSSEEALVPPGPFHVAGMGDVVWAAPNGSPVASASLGNSFFGGSAAGGSGWMYRGTFGLRVAPLEFLDVGLGFLYALTANSAQEPRRVDTGFDAFPSVRLSWGSSQGALGLALLGRIRAGINEAGPQPAASVYGGRLLGDVRLAEGLWLRGNLGVSLDRTSHLVDGPLSDAYRYSAEVSQADALTLLAAGIDYQPSKRVQPYLTLQAEVPVHGAPAGAGHKRGTVGVRIGLFEGLMLDAQVSGAFGGGSGVPVPAPFLTTLLLSYNLWPTRFLTVKQTVVVEHEGPMIVGNVVRRSDGRPVSGAVVSAGCEDVPLAATGEGGGFRLGPFDQTAPCPVKVSMRGFEPAEGEGVPGGEKLEIALEPKVEKASLTGAVTDTEGKPIEVVDVEVRWPAARLTQQERAHQGRYEMELEPGEIHVTLKAERYLSLGRTLKVEPGARVVFDAALRRRPGVDSARLDRERISLSQRVNFAFNTDVLEPDAKLLLDEVASILLIHAEIEQIKVAGHTDEIGSAAFNQLLSERRAARVVEYLESRGVEATRLVARGYGRTMPVRSNATEAGRAVNRRVEFLILSRPAAKPPATID
ncbi:MAG: OmpA family protein [Deltaproteobacteria bacterium]|nr:OmpA family protein [Deltaproteobacteria bacterium]